MTNDAQDQIIGDLRHRKAVSREYLRALSPIKKIEHLFSLQEQYYQMLVAREENGGIPVPEKWHKWYRARHGLPLNG